jgi:hypothetical protein
MACSFFFILNKSSAVIRNDSYSILGLLPLCVNKPEAKACKIFLIVLEKQREFAKDIVDSREKPAPCGAGFVPECAF